MLKQTAQLFVKALIIGLLLNIILHQVPIIVASAPVNSTQFQNRPLLKAPAPETISDFSE